MEGRVHGGQGEGHSKKHVYALSLNREKRISCGSWTLWYRGLVHTPKEREEGFPDIPEFVQKLGVGPHALGLQGVHSDLDDAPRVWMSRGRRGHEARKQRNGRGQHGSP